MSKDVIKKILQDTTQYTDDAQITIAGQTVTLGDLRGLDADERKAVNDAVAAANTLRDKALQTSAKAQEVYDNYSAKVKELEGKTVIPPNNNGAPDPWKTDAWLAPVDQRFLSIEKHNEELRNLVKQVSTIVGNGMLAVSENRWDDQYRSIDWGSRQKKSRDEMIEYAKTNRLLDRNGLPSISAAYDHITAPERQKQQEESLLEKGRQQGIAETLASRFQAPNVPGPGLSAPPPKIPAGGDVLGNLYTEAMADPALSAMIQELGSLQLV